MKIEKVNPMLLKKIKKWYSGEQKIYGNEPDSPLIRIGVYTERHWTANIAHSCVTFYSKHWQWIWGSVLIPILLLLFTRS